MSESAATFAREALVRPRRWDNRVVSGLAALPVLALLAGLFGGVLTDLWLLCWTDPAASQGLLIPPLAAYIVFLRWPVVMLQPAKVEIAGLGVVAAGAAVLAIGTLGAELFLSRISFVVVIAGIVWTFWGKRRLGALSLPLLLLASMIPLPALVYGALAGPLQLLASSSAEWIAEAAGVTLYREGNTLLLANISLGVEEACSGLTSLSSIIIAALLFGYLFCNRGVSRLSIVVSAIPIAIAANVIRVAGTAVLSDSQPAFALGFYHAFSGWVVFGIATIFLYIVTSMVRRYMEPVLRESRPL